MNNTTNPSSSDNHPATKITVAAIVVCFYIIGVFLHIKIIKVSKRENELTWKIDITHSILAIGLYTYTVFMHTATYLVKDLYLFTGEWFCYASKVINTFMIFYLGWHSLLIAMMKYFFIVHDDTIRNFKDKFKTGLFYLNLLYPMLSIAVLWALIPNFFVIYEGYAEVNRCFGKYNRKNWTTWFWLCDSIQPIHMNSAERALYILKWGTCKLQIIFVYMSSFNILDAFFYCRTFAYMRRNVLPNGNNVASRYLSQRSNELRKKRLHVNSQVTSITTILESLYIILYSIVHGHITKGSTFITLIQSMGLYFILLPYSHLMNTSYNKNRIVEIGWKNVFRNLFGSLGRTGNDNTESLNKNPKDRVKNTGNLNVSNSDSSSSEANLKGNCKNKCSLRGKILKNDKNILTPHRAQKATGKLSNEGRNLDNKDIFIISTTTNFCMSKEMQNGTMLHVPFNEQPTTSKDCKIKKRDTVEPGRRSLVSSDEDEAELLKKEYSHIDAKRIIRAMTDSLADEELYINHFKELLEFEYGSANGKYASSINKELLYKERQNIIMCNSNKKDEVIESDYNTRQSLDPQYLYSRCEFIIGSEFSHCNPNLKREKEERNSMRKGLLSELGFCNDKDANYDFLIQKLIDLEERFVEEI